jgi:hypothetical protein
MVGSNLLFDNSDFEKGTLENGMAEGGAMTVQPTKGIRWPCAPTARTPLSTLYPSPSLPFQIPEGGVG